VPAVKWSVPILIELSTNYEPTRSTTSQKRSNLGANEETLALIQWEGKLLLSSRMRLRRSLALPKISALPDPPATVV
jgi:hypothetical protein